VSVRGQQRVFRLAPYFHPTTFCFVDDNERFLESLQLELPDSMALRMFTQPEPALAFVNQSRGPAPIAEHALALERTGSTAALHLDTSLIEAELANTERFARLSVALVDYAMPSMNAVEFFDRMTDPYTRRAMLTGVADERLAVDLFNEGRLHHFLQKQRAQDIDALVGYMFDMESEYFRQSLARLQMALDLHSAHLFSDPAVATYVQRLMQRERLVEYYYVEDPAGFLLLRADGSVVRLIILTPAERAAQIAMAREYGAPAALQKALERGELVFSSGGDSPANYFGSERFPWDEFVVPAQALAGSVPWLVGIQHDPPMDIDFDPRQSSYDAYLAKTGRG
jgi:CheY-like chemotaxis protein